MSWIAIDTETGGLDPRRHALLSFAYETEDGDRGSFLIADLGGVISREAQAINGISRKMIERDGIPIDEARRRIQDLCTGRTVIGHNVKFDLDFLARLFVGSPLAVSAVDTLALMRDFVAADEIRNFKLATCAEYFGIEIDEERLHTASGDVEITAALYRALLAAPDHSPRKQAEIEERARRRREKERADLEQAAADARAAIEAEKARSRKILLCCVVAAVIFALWILTP